MEPDKVQHDHIMDWTQRTLTYVAEYANKLFPSELVPPFRDAWRETNPKLMEAKKYIQENWGALMEGLEKVGLTSYNLRLKYEGIRSAFGPWDKNKDDVSLLRILLEWLRSFFGSLIDEVPGKELIKEFIDAVLKML